MQRISTAPANEAQLRDIFDQLQAIEQPGSGLVQTVVMRSRSDPNEVFVLVLFDSEENARAREQDPRRQEPLQRIRAGLTEVVTGPPEFFDCDVILTR